MTIIAIAGDEIVCSNGHVCGTLLIDVNSGDRIVFPKYRFDGKSPFSLEFYPKVDTRPDPTWTAGPVFAVQNGRNAEG